jgi:protein TonB
VLGGVAGGDSNATGKGVVHGIAGGIMGDDGRVYFARNAPLPMFQVRQLYPEYPEQERQLGFEDDVVVRYIIGIDGKVKSLMVLEHPQYKAFERSTLKAIRDWQFKPLFVDGEAREVVHEMLVRFRLER